MNALIFAILIVSYMMVVSKRISALIKNFMLQSLFLFFLTLFLAIKHKNAELYAVAGLLLTLKVIVIPFFLGWIIRKIKINENLGLVINPVLSLAAAVSLSLLAYFFTEKVVHLKDALQSASFAISLSITMTGLLIMISRMKAIAQVTGLLVMENGLFLSVAALCTSMPFFVEIAIFFDIFTCAIILGVFMFRINELFTHIDIDRLTSLKG